MTEPGAARDPAASGDATDGAGDDLVGTVLAGRYRILSKLGEGAMGAVYLGEHLKIGRRDAIKVLRGPLIADAEAIARFNRGARNVAAIQHPNVCTIYDYSDTDDGTPFLAMEFIAGESLKELLDREGPLTVGRAARIARQIADALYAAHSAGIVHRDLKPANIMLTARGEGTDEVRVVDFDIAKGSQDGEEGEVTRLGFVIGTPEYMSPEQLMADRLDGRSDVYSLGIVLFRMLTGSLPFPAGSGHESVLRRLTHPPLKLGDVLPDAGFPPRLQAVLDRALERGPADRQPSAAEFARELMESVADVAGAPRPAEPRLSATGIVPAQPAGGRADDVPETRASASAVPGTVASPAAGGVASERQPRSRVRVPIAAPAGLVLVLALGLGWALLQRDAPPEPAPERGAESVVVPADVGITPTGPAEAEPSELFSEPTDASPAPTGRETQQPAATARTSPAADSEPSPPPAVAPAPARPGAAELAELLDRQFAAVGPRRSASQLSAHRDTASLLWQSGELNTDLRARAAFVAASASHFRGEPGECLRWIERALQLNSTNRTYLGLHRDCGG